MKTVKNHNVIILDKSGSMSSIREQAITSTNETIQSIRMAAKRDPENLQFLTLVAFCGCEVKVIFDNKPIVDVKDISKKDYEPCCMTPLYDAIGQTIVPLHEKVCREEATSVAVTIITDGYENASREFNGPAIARIINDYKEEGWLFTYMGADHDVEKVAMSINIDNHMMFDKSEEGIKESFSLHQMKMREWYESSSSIERNECMKDEERLLEKKRRNKGFFGL